MNLDKWTSGEHYDQWMGRWSRLVADQFLAWLDLPAHWRYLDVCCGSGVLTEALMERCRPASVAGIDASPEQIRFALAHRSFPGVSFAVGDALHLPFSDDSFDVAVSGLGLNYVPNPEQALSEMCRVIVPHRPISAYVWDYLEGARFLREFWDAAAAVDPDAPTYDQARRFPLCTPSELHDLFVRAGLTSVEVVPLSITTKFASFDDYWQPLLTGQGSAPNYLATRREPVRHAISERLRAALPIATDGSIVLPARAWAVRGRC